MDVEFDIFYYIKLLKKWLKKIGVVVAISMSLTVISSMLKPDIYYSNVTFLLPGSAIPVSSSSAITSIAAFSIGMSSKEVEVIMAIVQSRRMQANISDHFKLSERPSFWWDIKVHTITGGLRIDVKATDPELAQKIANFCVENLENINTELGLTVNRQMVKILDKATYGVRQGKGTVKKAILAGIFAFLACAALIIFADFIKKLKLKRNR